jgi:hypothetical protein
MGMLDDELLDVPCETCGRDIKVRAGELRRSPTLTCACGQEIKVDATQLDAEMGKADASISGLDAAIQRMNKTIGG